MSIWKIHGNAPQKVTSTTLSDEKLLEQHLEDWVAADTSMLGEPLLVIGRQVVVPEINDRLDLLALDLQGNAVIIELKRGKLSDPVDMQALRYASYISKWEFADFEQQAAAYFGGGDGTDFNFNEVFENFCTEAGSEDIPDLNSDQRVIIVGSEVRERLGSVALWLRDHSIDIKVIEIELFREMESLFIQPRVVIPLPVSRFSSTGKSRKTAPSKPWLSDGQKWHLEKRCSAETKQMVLDLDQIIKNRFEDVDGPRWGQKLYVAYRISNFNWMVVGTFSKLLRLRFMVSGGRFSENGLAARLGLQIFDEDDSLADKLALSSSVGIRKKNSCDVVLLRVRKEFDLNNPQFLAFLSEAHAAFPK